MKAQLDRLSDAVRQAGDLLVRGDDALSSLPAALRNIERIVEEMRALMPTPSR